MADYNNFTQVLRDRKGTPEKREPFVSSWLRKTYGIDYGVNPDFFAELTRPHDHDNLDLHYGQVPHDSGFGTVVAELVKDGKGQWRIGVNFDPDAKQRTVLQPEAEASDANRDARLRLLTIISAPTEPQAEGIPVQATSSLNFKPGSGRFGDINSLYASRGEGDGGLHAPVHPAHIPAYLTQAGEEPKGLPVNVGRYLRPGGAGEPA